MLELRDQARQEGYVDYSRKDKGYLCRMLSGNLTREDYAGARTVGDCPPHEGIKRLRSRADDLGLDYSDDDDRAALCEALAEASGEDEWYWWGSNSDSEEED